MEVTCDAFAIVEQRELLHALVQARVLDGDPGGAGERDREGLVGRR